MSRKKPYDDGCATAHALDLIGERWALLIVRELVPGPKRFSDLKQGLPGISTNILTNRLNELEAGHVLVRDTLPPPSASQIYRLTDWGAELESIIKDIGRWAARSPNLQPGKPMSAASVMLSFRTMFSAEKAEGVTFRLSLELDGVPHHAEVSNGEFTIDIGETDEPDACMVGDPNLLAAMVYGGMAMEDAEAAGLKISGLRECVLKFCSLFPLPPKAPATSQRGDA